MYAFHFLLSRTQMPFFPLGYRRTRRVPRTGPVQAFLSQNAVVSADTYFMGHKVSGKTADYFSVLSSDKNP